MTRRCSPAVWARALRDHGPPDAMMKLCLLTLKSWMNASGYAYPSQKSIAAGASVSEKTVQKALKRAHKAGWIDVEPRGLAGQKWKLAAYTCCVPDHVSLSKSDQEIHDRYAEQSEQRPERQRGPLDEGPE